MFETGEFFSETHARRENCLTRMDPRTKLAFTALSLILCLGAPHLAAPFLIFLFCLGSLLAIGVEPPAILKRLLGPLLLAMVVLTVQTFFSGRLPLFNLEVGGLTLTGYRDGLFQGLSTMGRIMGGTSLVLFLAFTTPVNRLAQAAAFFRAPEEFIELTLLVYRYVFVLSEEAGRIKEAQMCRLGYLNWKRSWRSAGILAGMVVIRAYDRARNIHEAMVARGSQGVIPTGRLEGFGRRHWLEAAGLSLAIILFLFFALWPPG
ncbi:MAG: cobalt ECF transporter T component CbiQ [Syntrophothermus sp.]